MFHHNILSDIFVWVFFLSLPVLCNIDISHCPLFMKPSVFSDEDLILNGFFSLYDLKLQPEIQKCSFLRTPMERSSVEWDWINYQYILAFLYAIEEINKDTHLLRNLTLGFSIYNALNINHKNLESILLWLSGGSQVIPNYNCQKQKASAAIIEGTIPQFLADIGPLLELYRIPQVSNEPFDSLLDDKDHFPSLYEMTSKENFLAHGLIYLLQHFDWTWVGFFAVQNMQAEKLLRELEVKTQNKDICIVVTVILSTDWIRKTKHKMTVSQCQYISKVNVSIVYSEAEVFIGIHIFVTACALSGRVWMLATELHIDLNEMKSTMDIFHGSLSLSPQKRKVPGFEHFVRTFNPSKYPEDFYTVKFWLDKFNCSFAGSPCGNLKNCSPNASLEFMPDNSDLMTMSESSYNIYNAVYAVGLAVHELLMVRADIELTSETNQPLILSWQLHPYLRNIQFTNIMGDHIFLNDERNIKIQYDILNIVTVPGAHNLLDNIGGHDFIRKVGEFVFLGSDNQSLLINEEIIEWPAGLKKPPISVCALRCGPGFRKVSNESDPCCFKCVFCPNGEISNKKDAQKCIQCSDQDYPNQERTYCLPKLVTYLAFEDFFGMALSCTALCFSILTVVILWIFMKHKNTPVVKANNRTLSYMLLISLLLCFLCSLLFIGHPNIVTCILQQVTFGIVFTLAVSTVLAKTITVILAFKAMKPGRTMRWLLVSGAPNYVIPICTVIQVIICGVWVGLSPPFIDIDAHSEPRHLLIVCNKGSVTAFYCVLGYLGSLALVSFSLSYLVRNLPDTFNEAKFLTFSMLVFCSIWVTFLPVYHSAQGKAMVTLEIFSILASSAGLLVSIFGPKCYIILLKPEKNSLKMLRTKFNPRNSRHS